MRNLRTSRCAIVGMVLLESISRLTPALAQDASAPAIGIQVDGIAVPGDTVQITSPAQFLLTVRDGSSVTMATTVTVGGAPVTTGQRAVGLPTPAPLSVSLASPGGNFEILRDTCSGRPLTEPGTTSGLCEVDVRARASSFGPISGTLTVRTGDLVREIPLSGTARNFDLPRLLLSVASGNPSSMFVQGPGSPAYSAPVRVRLLNESLEMTASPISLALGGADPSFFEIVAGADGCTSLALGPRGTCEFEVRAKASAPHPGFSGTVQVQQHNKPLLALNGSADGFCVPSNHITGYGSCSASCGGGTRDVYWSNGCGSAWTTQESCNTAACAPAGFATANGQQGTVSARSDQHVTWGWDLGAPATGGTSRTWGTCPRPPPHENFTWPNGRSSGTELGSSADRGRAGCSQEVCFQYAGTGNACVTVNYAPPPDAYNCRIGPSPSCEISNRTLSLGNYTTSVAACGDDQAPTVIVTWNGDRGAGCACSARYNVTWGDFVQQGTCQ